ncbi:MULTISPECIES: GcvT family protein [Mycobacteriaceae]|uniref:FAD-dependent oxidoreductase n=1 Tax=Mycolicibacterium parafortuitum TaxID=39692 RepID=A0ACC6MN76_MYCPF|nr:MULTISPECIES: FAD-dependent oxidoreductase [Mycobacteriaceae]MDZ5088391.1 FAD-dependent oxidoreductase [Mycolicibacterium parafortuitum]MEC9324175.1 FAD-dependent oxidoreductase [Actinomycetota bacterium]GFM16107.1 glycine cleavage system T protein (aminomethyltransferase) [Mycobacterium sp. PO1]GFM26368.1 glycine cleavage system T protein (aminomethyltransferase) [Mycobacterium sp. PO2]
MPKIPKIVVIGAGIVGTSLADELTARGYTDVTVVDRGPMFATGGSTSHAPGLVFQTNASKTMTAFARYTVEKFNSLEHPGGWAFNQVGGLEVATTPERWADLHRKAGWAQSWGIEGRLLDPAECVALHPLIDRDRILGGFHTPHDGLAKALRAAEAQARRAEARGATLRPHTEVLGVLESGGRVTGVRTADGVLDADIVVCAAGFWGAQIARQVGLVLPLVPMAHQYARTGQVADLVGRNSEYTEAGLPILRHQDRDLYFREHVDRLGIGSYSHKPMPVDMSTLLADTADEAMPSMLPFTEEDFAPAWKSAVELLPTLSDSKIEEAFNGVFSFTPDGHSIMGEHRELSGFWVVEAVWVTHSAGVAKAAAEWIVNGTPSIDVHECDLYRFEDVARSPKFIAQTSSQAFVEVYDIIHPHQHRSALRGLRTSPFHARQVQSGAFFYEGGGWERPAWYDVNAALMQRLADEGLHLPDRDEWAARFWSPISVAEAHWTRTHVAMYDMTPLTRYEVAGPGALTFLQQLTTNNVDKSTGSVTYTLLLDERGGIRSDLTVARLARDVFQVGANSPLDFDWLSRHKPADVVLRDVTGGTCCVGVWGPAARDVVAPLCPDDLSNTALRYFRAVRTHLGAIPVTLMRVSYVGELGWEIYAGAEYGAALWDLLAEAGRDHGIIPAGRIAFDSLRIEKGYRSWGTDMTVEHTPAAAGLGFAVRMEKAVDFVGRAALNHAPPPSSMLRSIVFDDPDATVLGKEPVFADGACIGYVTSAGHSPMLGRTVAYAWLPADVGIGDAVTVDYRGDTHSAVVSSEPVVDPEMARIKR